MVLDTNNDFLIALCCIKTFKTRRFHTVYFMMDVNKYHLNRHQNK